MKEIPDSEIFTEIILNIFKLNGLLLLEGDQITHEFGLTSARWKVLGAIALSPDLITVPKIARNMGLSRQAVQRLVNELVAEKFLKFNDNPEHKRAKLLSLTKKGELIYSKLEKKQKPWADTIAKSVDKKNLEICSEALINLITKIESK